MKQKVLSDNGYETIIIKYDGERFGLVKKRRNRPDQLAVIILNTEEAKELSQFIKEESGGAVCAH